VTGPAQPVGYPGVEVEPLRLEVRREGAALLGALVPVDAQPVQGVQDGGESLGGVAGEVGVLDAEDEGASVVPGERPVEQGAPHVADVEVAGR
jgi:hypothetical protein